MSESIRTANGVMLDVQTKVAGDVGRSWEWNVRSEHGHVCTAELQSRALSQVPGGEEPHEGAWTRDQILSALAWAVQRALVSPPEKKPGEAFHVNVTSFDLYEAEREVG